MGPAVVSIALPAQLASFVKEQADEFGMSIEQWLLRELEIDYKLQQETNEFFAARAKGVSHERWEEIMAQVPNVSPMPGDELR